MKTTRYLLLLTGLAALGISGCSAQGSEEELKRLRKEVDAIRESQRAMQKDLEDIKNLLRGRQQPQPPQDVVLNLEDSPSMGQKSAKVTLVEFSDYQCPFCARHALQTLPQIISEYVKAGKVKYVLRDFPLESIHPAAAKAAEAAHCAGEQGKYWEMHDRLVNNVKGMDAKLMPDQAKAIGLDAARFQQCYDSGKYSAKVQKDLSEGMKAGVSGTPTFFLGPTTEKEAAWKATKSLVGAVPFANFKEALDSLLAGK